MKNRFYPLSLFWLFAIGLCLVQNTASAQLQAKFSANTTGGCAPLVVQFRDESPGNPSTWRWDLGNGTISLFQHPSTVYFVPGTYPVKLVVKNTSGADSIVTQDYITVYANPVASFFASDSIGCFPFNVKFTDKSTAAGATVTKWHWDFGDGVTSILQSPQHTYYNSGNHTVTLKITTDKGCTQTFSKDQYIRISSGVNSEFSDSADKNCKAPVKIFFTGSSNGPGTLSYSWDFGDGNKSTAQNPVHTYTANGTYSISLITTSNAGCSDTLRKTGYVKVGATVTQFDMPDSVCYGEIIPINNISLPVPVKSVWNFGDGSGSIVANPQKAFFVLGNLNVKLVNTYEKCIDSITKRITVFSKPAASFASHLQSFCSAPATVKFSGGDGQAYRWEFGDGKTANTKEVTHTYTSYGKYTVKLFVTGAGGCIDSIVKKDYIVVARPQVKVEGLPTKGCIGLTVPFSAITTGINLNSWHWDFGDGTSSTQAAPQKTYNNEGTFTVKLTYTTESGCKDSIVLKDTVRVSKKPKIDFSATPTDACAVWRIQFKNLSEPRGTKWHWELGDGGSTSFENFVYKYTDTGYFDVKLVVWNNECADTLVKPKYMHINPPVSRFNVNMKCDDKYLRTFTNNSIGAKTWQWDFGDGSTSNDWNTSHRYANRGLYKVKLTVTNGSCADSTIRYITITDEKLDFSANLSEVCRGGSVVFTPVNYNSNYIASTIWQFGDGNSSNQSGIVNHTYNKPGTYRVMLRFTDINGCHDTVIKQQFLKVHGPTAAFNAQQQTICFGASALFVDKSISDGVHPITEWTWNYGDGTISNQPASPYTHNYADTGKYNVTLTVKDSYGCVDTLMKPSAIIISKPSADFAASDTVSCPGKSIGFTNYSNGTNLQYTWDFGDGTTSTKQNPTHTYTSTGIFTVSLSIADTYGCAGSITRQKYIQVFYPVAAFSVSDSISSCPPLQVKFTSAAKNYSSLKWDFGDGSVSSLENPEHFYNTPGTYYVKQIIKSPGGCTDTAVKKMIVKGPQGKFTYSPLAGCKPLTVLLKASSNSGKVSFAWDFNDGTVLPSTDSSVTHTYTSAGNFLPKLVLIDSTGCRVPITGKDTLKVVGVTARAAMNEYRACNDGFIQFNDKSVANDYITGHHWDFGDGNISTEANPRHHYKAVGIYTVKHIAITSLGCRDTTTLSDTVKVWAKPEVTILGANEACEPAALGFRPRVLAGDSAQFNWQWNFGNGKVAGQAMVDSQFYSKAGNYTVSLQVSYKNFCRDTANLPVNIRPLPKTFAGNDTFVCRDKPVLLTAKGADRYVWNAAPGLSCTDCAGTMINPTNNITYVVTGYTAYGCASKDSISVRVRQRFDMQVMRGDTLCQGESARLNASGAELYQWFPADGLNNQFIADPKATPQTTTIYTVVGRDADNCFTDSAKVPVIVYPIPQIFAGNDTSVSTGTSVVLKTNSSADINKYRWSPATNLSCIDCPAPTAAIRNTITYRVDVSNAGGCKSFDDVTIHAVCNGGNYFLPNTFSPNGDGSNDVFYVRGKGVNRIQSLRIFNRWGQLVFEKRDITPNDPSAGWDGTFNGKRADMDVYIYIAEVICENSAIVALKGDITLIR